MGGEGGLFWLRRTPPTHLASPRYRFNLIHEEQNFDAFQQLDYKDSSSYEIQTILTRLPRSVRQCVEKQLCIKEK